MKIALTSHAFYPAVGGIETMSMLLANELTSRGHQVTVVTETPADAKDEFPFEVVRAPGVLELFRVVRRCDVLFQNNISLRTLGPALILRKPWVVRHATWIRRMSGALAWQDQLKRWLLRYSIGISNSQATADDLPVATTVIGNCYRDDVFHTLPDAVRDLDIVFLGRLVSDKGPQLLLDAIHRLEAKGLKPSVTFIGAGPELEVLQRSTRSWGLEQQVWFAGQKAGTELVALLNRHRIMVVPSIWNEPFGIVALEGIACGCAIIGSEGGGLKDAIGPCGLTFENGNVDQLTNALEKLLKNPAELVGFRSASEHHLRNHTTAHVVDRYLEVLASAIGPSV